ncbi:MAG: DUF3413 domain-containing protein [Alteromonadaceae bacterium]|nr:DUF3413 domain-containing protein [Alteromonadaceae bacterium]
MVSFNSKSYSKRLLHLISWSHWFTFINIIAAIGLSSFYLFSESAPETIFGQAYLLTTWISHMGFLTFMSFVLILFPLTLLFPQTKFIRTTASIIFTIELLLLILDAFIYNRLGYHLNASSSEQIITLIANQIDHNRRSFWFVSIVLCLLILSFEFVVSNYAWKHLKQLQKTVFARFFVLVLVVSFVFSHITHIWADANLEYDILRQDTVFPLSYPSTAKTLLTKYGMFNQSDYIERRTSPLSFTQAIPPYPQLDTMGDDPCLNADLEDNLLKDKAQKQTDQNNQTLKNQQSVFIVLSKALLSEEQIEQFSQRAQGSTLTLNHHIDNALPTDAWFNLFYGLPSIYQKEILQQKTSPLLFQAIDKLGLAKTFTVISDNKSNNNRNKDETNVVNTQYWFESLFDQKIELSDISSLIFPDKLNKAKPGLHLIYFDQNATYQFELFIDALLLAQKQKTLGDIVWIGSIGNEKEETRLSKKSAMLILPSLTRSDKRIVKNKRITLLTSQMDLQSTLLENWLSCKIPSNKYSNGSNVSTIKQNRIIANTVKHGIMVFNKDKSVFIDQNGNFQSYSTQLQTPIMINADFPLMIDGVHFIKQFSNNNKVTDH